MKNLIYTSRRLSLYFGFASKRMAALYYFTKKMVLAHWLKRTIMFESNLAEVSVIDMVRQIFQNTRDSKLEDFQILLKTFMD